MKKPLYVRYFFQNNVANRNLQNLYKPNADSVAILSLFDQFKTEPVRFPAKIYHMV